MKNTQKKPHKTTSSEAFSARKTERDGKDYTTPPLPPCTTRLGPLKLKPGDPQPDTYIHSQIHTYQDAIHTLRNGI